MVIVQHITVEWTKHSRGAPEAARRSAVPSAVPVSLDPLDDWVFQEVSFHEASGFRQRAERQLAAPDCEEQSSGLLLRLGQEGLHVGFRWNFRFGAPWRPDRPNAFTLSHGQYGRVVVNGRHPLEFTYAYSLHTFNITLVETPTADAFTARRPDQLVDLRESLF